MPDYRRGHCCKLWFGHTGGGSLKESLHGRSDLSASAPATAARATRTREPERAARQRPQRRQRTAMRRFLAMLALAIVFTAAVAIAVIIATDTSNTAIHLRRVVANDVQSAVKSLQDLIGSNTK